MTKQQRLESPLVGAWPLDDEVIALRVLGTDKTYELSQGSRVSIGTSSACNITLRDGAVAALHAKLARHHARWTIRAIDGAEPAELRRDGVPLREFPLVPGIEIGLGNVTLVAESARSQALDRFLVRLIGLGASQRPDVERARRTVLSTASGRGVLTLRGRGDLAAVARQLHRYTLDDRPFVMCDPRRGRQDANVRGSQNIADPMAALEAAAGGTLCVVGMRLPRGFGQLVERRRRSTTRVQLVLCTSSTSRVLATVADPVVVQPLAKRPRDRIQIVDDLAVEAAAALGVPDSPLSAAERRIIFRFDGATLPELEKAALRVVALRHWNTTRAARALGMSHAALNTWTTRRGLGSRGARGT